MPVQDSQAVRAAKRGFLTRCFWAHRVIGVEESRRLLAAAEPAAAPAAPDRPRQLLADVSVIVKRDAGTGVQRVVRELLRQLIAHPPPGYAVRPIHATWWRGYRYAEAYRSKLAGPDAVPGPRGPVQVHAGDVFLGMDLAAHVLPYRAAQLARWKAAGVGFHFIVYDLLPVLRPEWFSNRLARRFRNWIRTVAMLADGVACISRSVSGELRQWVSRAYGERVERAIAIGWFHLGSDPVVKSPGPSEDSQLRRMVAEVSARPSVLMVGTLEPRKSYALALRAFEKLWAEGRDVNLVIVGRVGWKVDELVDRLRRHPEAGKRLTWLQDASDELLDALYQAAVGLLMASEGEGFGLPIIEAARYGKPILARDIPVFREIAGSDVTYFENAQDGLEETLGRWLDLVGNERTTASSGIEQLTWHQSANELLRLVLKHESSTTY